MSVHGSHGMDVHDLRHWNMLQGILWTYKLIHMTYSYKLTLYIALHQVAVCFIRLRRGLLFPYIALPAHIKLTIPTAYPLLYVIAKHYTAFCKVAQLWASLNEGITFQSSRQSIGRMGLSETIQEPGYPKFDGFSRIKCHESSQYTPMTYPQPIVRA